MQYILSQGELDALTPKTEVDARDKALAAVRVKLLDLSGFECIHAADSCNEYCDGCPCSRIGDGNDYQTWKLVCTQTQDYSK